MINKIKKYSVKLIWVIAISCFIVLLFKYNQEIIQDHVTQISNVPSNPSETEEPYTIAIPSKRISDYGNTITGIEIDSKTHQAIPKALYYTPQKVTLFENFAEADIKPKSLTEVYDSSVFDEKHNLLPGVKFLTADIEIENICANTNRNITEIELICVYSKEKNKDDTTNITYRSFVEPAYFSEHSEDSLYYHYNIHPGEKKKITMGWYVNTELHDVSKMYLSTCNGDLDYMNIVKLDLEQE